MSVSNCILSYELLKNDFTTRFGFIRFPNSSIIKRRSVSLSIWSGDGCDRTLRARAREKDRATEREREKERDRATERERER